MRCGLLATIVALCGCDGVFKLVELPPAGDADVADVPAQACRYATIAAEEPGQDEDGDTIINSLDACPTVAGATEHDEDGDGASDACDPCPAIVAAGDDAECDLVGAACDPDDRVAHVQTFFGFGDAVDLDAYEVTIADDRATGPTDPSGGDLLTTMPATPIARYEISGHVRQIDSNYRSIGIDFDEGAAGAHYACQLGVDTGYWVLTIAKNNIAVIDPVTGPAKHEHGAPPPMSDLAFRLVVDYDGARLTATLSGDLDDTVSAAAALGNVRYGPGYYHALGRSDVEVDYLRRVAPSNP